MESQRRLLVGRADLSFVLAIDAEAEWSVGSVPEYRRGDRCDGADDKIALRP